MYEVMQKDLVTQTKMLLQTKLSSVEPHQTLDFEAHVTSAAGADTKPTNAGAVTTKADPIKSQHAATVAVRATRPRCAMRPEATSITPTSPKLPSNTVTNTLPSALNTRQTWIRRIGLWTLRVQLT